MLELDKSKNNFSSWLAEYMPVNAANIKSSINTLNILLLKNKIIQRRIIQITDIGEIDVLIDRIKNNIGINIHSRRQKKSYLTALDAYKKYLKFLSSASKDKKVLEDAIKDPTDELPGNSNKNMQVSFTESRTSYRYTHPVELQYFDEHYAVKSWSQTYVQVVKCLFKDYPDKIRSLIGSNIGGNGRVNIADSVGADTMVAPKEIADDLYLETNESADHIVKKIGQLLEMCEIDYEKVVITYSTLRTSKTRNFVSISSENVAMQSAEESVSFYNWLIKTQGISEATAKNYISAIKTVDEYVQEHHVGYRKIRGTLDYTMVRKTIDALFQTAEFVELNQKQHNRFRAALTKYIQYLSGSGNSIGAKISEHLYANVDFEPYKKILLEYFPKGFRISSMLDMRRFRMCWARKYGTELNTDDDTVRKYISHITVRYRDFVYLPETMLDTNTTERILTYLSTCFKQGKVAVYFNALYKEFQADFVGKRINNSDMLKSYLSYINDGRFYIHKNYLTAEADVVVNPVDEVRNYLIIAGGPVTLEELKAELSHIDEGKINSVVAGSNSAEFVRNRKGEYFHADIIDFTQAETNTIIEMIQQTIDDKGYMAGRELTDTIAIKLPDIMERYPFLTWLGLRDVIAYKLKDMFSFKGKIISAYGQQLSMFDVFAHFARSREYFTLEQLNSLKRYLDTPIYFDAVYANSLRINKDEFVSRDKAAFDVAATDAAIDRFCTGDYIALKEIDFFGSFPDAGFPWNEFLLEHYVSDFSKKYKLLHVGFTASTPVGAIVKRNSNYENFDELITTVLANSNISLNTQTALQYLVDIGMMARKKYTGIERILMKAKQQRIQKGT
jgi:hypothetical protein